MSRTSGKNNRTNATTEDRRKWAEAWSRMMVDIWQEKTLRLQIMDTGALYQSVSEAGKQINSERMNIEHIFVQYGMFVDAGVGKGFRHDNGGDLGFTPVRQPRRWFSRPYFSSVMSLKDKMAHMYGQEFVGIVCDGLGR